MPRAAAALLALVATACADLPSIPRGECGNGVVDPGEDCDTIVDVTLGSRARCGAPGFGARACRLVCDNHAGCPDGWGCGAGGVCRFARGDTPAGWQIGTGSPFELPSEAISVGDVDGDRLFDVFGFGGASFAARYGSGDGRFPAETTFATELSLQRPAFARVDGDARLDAVLALPSGVYTLLGGADHTLTPFAHPARRETVAAGADFYRPVRVRNTAGHGLLHVAGDTMTLYPDASLETGARVLPLPDGHLAAQLAGDIAIFDIDRDDDDDLVMAFTGDTSVIVYTLETVGGAAMPVEHARLPLPAGFLVLDGVQPVDVNGDGLVDLLVGMRPRLGVPEAVAGVASATSPGVFAGVQRAPLLAGMTTAGCGSSEWPLAAGDLTGDGQADYVGAFGVCVVTGGTLARTGQNPSPVAWTSAVVADFNHDGQNDVAAAASGLVNVDFLLGNPAGGGRFNYARALTAAPPARLATGDFNGDFVADVAVAEGGNVLSVIFGAAGGLPAPAVVMGRFGQIARLDVADLDDNGSRRDLASDLVVDERPPADDGTRALTFLHGNAERAMAAPFALRVGPGVFDVAEGVAAGDLDGDGDTDVAVFARDGTAENRGRLRIWLLRGDGSGRWVETVRSGLVEPAFDPACALYTTAKLTSGPATVIIAAGARCLVTSDAPALGTLRFTADGEVELRLAPLDADELSLPNDVEVADVDLDGAPELLVTFSGTDRIAVYPVRGGQPDLLAPLLIEGFPAGVTPLAVTPIGADRDPEPELAILTSGGVYLADRHASRYVVEGPVVPLGLSAGNRIVAGDLDDDGLEDLVFNGPSQVHVIMAVGQTLAESR